MIERFFIKPEWSGVPGTLDFKKIVALPDADFAQIYLELMNQYRDINGWWQEGKIPHCFKCHEVIDAPTNLRRYYGLSLHPRCFGEVYFRERKRKSKTMRKYFDRVAFLKLS